MFEIEKDNAKIGKHLEKLILAKHKSIRQFCREYLKLSKGNYDKTEKDNCDKKEDEKELDNMATRMSAIIKGKKSIQFYDLPIFCELLEVSCEEIITAGRHYEPISGHVTNYEIAFSKDRNKWEKYINRPDKLILNPDEYCKTVIDYALEFKNYDFIKYLMDKNYIWFVDNSENDGKKYIFNRAFRFGAGTSIEKRKFSDTLDADLLDPGKENKLRQSLIALAIENKDIPMLDTLRAREIPALYEVTIDFSTQTNCEDYYDDTVIEEIVTHNEVLDYFTDDIKIKNQFDNPQMFIYPYIGKVLERLIEIKSKNAEYVIRRITEHNQAVYEKLQSLINIAVEITNLDPMFHFGFNDDEGFLSYMVPGSNEHFAKFCANVIRTDIKSNDPTIEILLNKLNESYDSVRDIKPNL